MSRYVIESGPWTEDRTFYVLDECDDKKEAYRAMVARAVLLRVYYEPHGGRKLRVRQEDTR